MIDERARFAAVDPGGIVEMLGDAAAEGDVEQLHAAADAEHGQLALERGAGERELEPVAKRVAGLVGGIGVLAVGGGVEIAPAGQQQAVDDLERLLGSVRVVGIDGDDQRRSAGPGNRLDVVVPDRAQLDVAPGSEARRAAIADHPDSRSDAASHVHNVSGEREYERPG